MLTILFTTRETGIFGFLTRRTVFRGEALEVHTGLVSNAVGIIETQDLVQVLKSDKDKLRNLNDQSVVDIAKRIQEFGNLFPPALLTSLIETHGDNTYLKRVIAGCPKCSEELIEKLYEENKNNLVLCVAIAHNRSTPKTVMHKLVAEHLGTNGIVVRMTVADNPSTPGSILRLLAVESEPLIVEKVAGNPSTPPDILNDFARSFHTEKIWRAVIKNPSTPTDSLSYVGDRKSNIRGEAEAEKRRRRNPDS
jgi:Zn ribbon nucleic-acid-binding protein